MPSFDYITAKEFRQSLESDDLEMRSCAEAHAWKSVQVLAGSIVESLLIDYLASTSHPARSSKDPLKMDLSEAIAICRSEGILSERSADLCSVIRSYRNLIHPGRMVRLAEQPPDKGSAAIAVALVDIIAEELARVRRAAVGLTAEQILSKVLRDSNSLAILKHLLQEVTEQQRERLLLEIFPAAYEEACGSEEPFDDTSERLVSAYRTILESVSSDVRKRVASEFVRVLRVEDGDRVVKYGAAFFRSADLAFVPVSHRAMVLVHILSRVPTIHTLDSLKLIEGIEDYLQPADVPKWLDPFISSLVSSTVKENFKQRVRNQLHEASVTLGSDVDAAIDRRLDDWIRHYQKGEASEMVELVGELKKQIDEQRLPF